MKPFLNFGAVGAASGHFDHVVRNGPMGNRERMTKAPLGGGSAPSVKTKKEEYEEENQEQTKRLREWKTQLFLHLITAWNDGNLLLKE